MANDRTVIIMTLLVIIIVVIASFYAKGMIEAIRTETITQQHNANRRMASFVRTDQVPEIVSRLPIMDDASKFVRERIPYSNLVGFLDQKLQHANAQHEELKAQVNQLLHQQQQQQQLLSSLHQTSLQQKSLKGLHSNSNVNVSRLPQGPKVKANAEESKSSRIIPPIATSIATSTLPKSHPSSSPSVTTISPVSPISPSSSNVSAASAPLVPTSSSEESPIAKSPQPKSPQTKFDFDEALKKANGYYTNNGNFNSAPPPL